MQSITHSECLLLHLFWLFLFMCNSVPGRMYNCHYKSVPNLNLSGQRAMAVVMGAVGFYGQSPLFEQTVVVSIVGSSAMGLALFSETFVRHPGCVMVSFMFGLPAIHCVIKPWAGSEAGE